ncbi:MAG: hypothetical protein GY838_01100 [bacterium]|nr:hypothetical protein [bacterium]
MTTTAETATKPLWLAMEGMIRDLTDQDLSAGSKEATVQRMAQGLDEAGYCVAGHAGHLLELRAAVDERVTAGRPLLADFDGAVAALGLDDVADTFVAAAKLVEQVGGSFPLLRGLGRRQDVENLMAQTRLDLLVAKANELGGEDGVRYLITAEVAVAVVLESLGITQEAYDEVVAKMAAEAAERKRVRGLLEDAGDKSEIDKVKHLLTNDVAEALIVELAGVASSAIDDAKQAMEAELAEKKRLEEEEAARKLAEAEGPSLDAIPDDEMLEYIEGIREIMEFSTDPAEIRMMCEQSDMPKALVEIAVETPDKLDELESNAGG